ncbi:D-2-hydroxyacid dehydrogenase [Entamoeba marina]
MKIVVLDAKTLGDISFEELNQFGDVTLYPTTKIDDVAERIKDCDIVMSNKVLVNEASLKQSPNVKLIVVLATGYNNIDIDYCKTHNIAVVNVAGYSTTTVAQHTLALLLQLYDKMPLFDNYVKSGEYSNSGIFTHVNQSTNYHDIEGKKWCICGLGAIGKKVALIANALGAKVCYYSTTGNNNNTDYERVSFTEMLGCDIITLHCPLNQNTKHMFNTDAFKKMKKSAVLINVGRGPLVVVDDVVNALKDGDIMGYGTDVFDVEPFSIDNPLLRKDISDKIVMTPHIAWASVESRERLFKEVVLNVESFLKGVNRNRIV